MMVSVGRYEQVDMSLLCEDHIVNQVELIQ